VGSTDWYFLLYQLKFSEPVAGLASNNFTFAINNMAMNVRQLAVLLR